MLNNACLPDLALYDYYLMPAVATLELEGLRADPRAIFYDDKSVMAVNTTYQPQRNFKLTAQVYDINLRKSFPKQLR